MGWRPRQWWSWIGIIRVCWNNTIDWGYGWTCFGNWSNVSNQEGTKSWTQHSNNNDGLVLKYGR